MTPTADQPLDLASLRARLAAADGKSFWRSLEEAAQTPRFQELLQREFTVELPEAKDVRGRRDFLKLMAASLALAGMQGCAQPPEEKIVPYVRAPEDIVPGKPLFYATAFTMAGYGQGVLAESHMGRPIKIEGNPQHPASLGATSPWAQASILGLYDPQRSQAVLQRGQISTWDRFLTDISQELQAFKNRKGQGLRILTETVTSPTLAAQLNSLREQLPELKWHQYEPFGRDHARAGARMAFGRYVETVYRLEQADVIVSLGSDFLVELPGSVRYAREFIDRRRVADSVETFNRLYVAESAPTNTGAMADHRLRVSPRQLQQLARALATAVQGESARVPEISGISSPWLEAAVTDLRAARGRSLVIAGESQSPVVHALAHAMNEALGNVGRTVQYLEPVEAEPVDQLQSLSELVDDMHNERVGMLVMLGGNPVYNAPGELNFADALGKVAHRIHLSEQYDETSFLCDWHLPAAHYLESWGDVRAFDGTVSIIQPLIRPLYVGRTAHEVLAVLQDQAGRSAHEIVQEHWRQQWGEEGFGRRWRAALHDGIVPDTASSEVEVQLQFDPAEADDSAQASAESIELLLLPDPSIHDGRFATNAWLQELPKPLTKITWDNALLVSPATAERLGLAHQTLADLTVGEKSITAPVWVQPGHADGCATLTAGYGRTMPAGSIATTGANVYPLRGTAAGWSLPEVQIRPTGRRYPLATTQQHHNMENRNLVRSTTIERYREDPHLLEGMHHAEVASFYEEYKYEGNAWGMVIDLTACIGCNACVVACQAENNVPVVGKDQVMVGREMHWLRIDQYYEGSLDDPQMHFQPLLCMHCEQAPCEVVCPVAATVHSSEGLNEMIYNRCVGTRYCSNNCPYKVRRFNYLQFVDEESPSLRLLRNPDVTVRSRGVMEKCTYCVQRINAARIEAKKEDRPIADGQVVTACQAACPTRAIVFGNINDQESQVHRLKQHPLNYGLLTDLNTKPRTTYLARVSNPHPDVAEQPAAGESREKEEGRS